jgi:2-polyprenyl-6-methoxyphenol hydroxylase-like FAD-dependent oxidoreductase
MDGQRKPIQQHADVSVLIVGAGPTGLTLACDLARRGVACRVIDKGLEYAVGSRGKGLQPRSLEVFDDLGVIDTALATGAPYPPIRAYDGETVVWEGHMHEHHDPTPDVPYTNVLMLPQWRTEEILRDRLAEYGGHVELATELTGFEQDDDGVTATLTHSGLAERVRVGYLVGADGGHSFVRRALGIGFEGETYETQRALIGDVCADGLDREHWHTWSNAAERTLRVGLCPLPGTNTFQFTAPIATNHLPELSLEALQKILDAESGRSDIQLHDLSWLSLYRVNIRMVNKYRVGRVFLAGDAAHVHSPAGGQGMNTGIQDAYNLGWKLGHALAGAPDALLSTYEEERLPIAADVLGISTKLHNRGVQGDPNALQRGSETQQLGLNYRGGWLARDDRDSPASIRAGDRAPDAPCHDATGTPVRLFDVFRGPYFTLLAFGASHAATVAAMNQHYGTLLRAYSILRPNEPTDGATLVDTHGHAYRAYDIDTDTLVLVRPDGYLGLITQHQSLDHVYDYLSNISGGSAFSPLTPVKMQLEKGF